LLFPAVVVPAWECGAALAKVLDFGDAALVSAWWEGPGDAALVSAWWEAWLRLREYWRLPLLAVWTGREATAGYSMRARVRFRLKSSLLLAGRFKV
jgi:hypothetical protein